MLTRREFSRNLLAGGTALLASGHSSAAGEPPGSADQSSDQTCDLLIKGGTVIDPAQHLHAPLDVAVRNGKILEISQDIPESRVRRWGQGFRAQVISARDKIVAPGFIELHVHCFDGMGYTYSRNADHYCLSRGVTTCVDGGSAGYLTLGEFVKYVIPASTTRIYAVPHIAAMGGTVDMPHRYQNLDWVDAGLTAMAVEQNKPAAVGIKVHLEKIGYTNPKESEVKVLTRALEAAEASHVPLMVHAESPYYSLPYILKMMRKGDVYTHCYNTYAPAVILDASGKILPEVREARERGIIFDTADGHKNLSFDLAEKALQQEFLPDTISSDWNAGIEGDLIYDLPTTVSKYMALGIPLDKAIELVTVKPAQVFNYGVQIGTLRPGSEADIGIFELHEGKFEFVDGKGGKRMGRQMLVSKYVVCRGQLFSNKTGNYPGETPWRYAPGE